MSYREDESFTDIGELKMIPLLPYPEESTILVKFFPISSGVGVQGVATLPFSSFNCLYSAPNPPVEPEFPA